MEFDRYRRGLMVGVSIAGLAAWSGGTTVSAAAKPNVAKPKVALGSVHRVAPSFANPLVSHPYAKVAGVKQLTVTPASHTYVVNTLTDDTLEASPPASTCADTASASLCSYRAAITVVENDLTTTPGTVDTVVLPAGDIVLTLAGAPTVDKPGGLILRGQGAGTSFLDGNNTFDDDFLYTDNTGLTVNVSRIGFKDDQTTALDFDEANVSIDHSSFSSNEDGAVYVDGGALEVTQSTFNNNTSTDDGAAVDDEASQAALVDSDTFTSNNSTDDYGGALYVDGFLELDNSTFTLNSAEYDGGAVYADENVNSNNNTFTSNSSADDEGGAIYVDENGILTDSTFKNNTADEEGGAVWDDDTAYLANDTFSGNTSTTEYGGDIYDDGFVTVSNSTFTNSTAEEEGGSINADGTLVVTGSTFTNSKTTDGEGGAIYSDDEAASLDHVTITGASAQGSDEYGGAIYSEEYLSITNSTITGSTATGGGGALYNDDYAVLNNDVLSNNKAEFGGGIYNEDELIINNTTISGNSLTEADEEGGGIYSDDYLVMNDSTLSGNSATGVDSEGGGLYNEDEAQLTNDTISGNTSYDGGGIYNDSYPFQVSHVTVANNTATDHGGGFYNDENDSEISSTGSLYSGNSPDQCALNSVSDVITSGGHNLDSGTTCGFTAGGDIQNGNAGLGALANNGGPTKTQALSATSDARGNGGDACPSADQRGAAVPTAGPCSIGAYYAAPQQLTAGHTLFVNQQLVSSDGRFRLVVQNDGNLVLYDTANKALWSSKTAGNGGSSYLSMQVDGNLVLYSAPGHFTWFSHTQGTGSNNRVVVQTDGNVVIYSGSTAVWSTGTAGSV